MQAILAAVDQLSPKEREQVRQHIETHEPRKAHRTPAEIAEHMALLEIINAMNER